MPPCWLKKSLVHSLGYLLRWDSDCGGDFESRSTKATAYLYLEKRYLSNFLMKGRRGPGEKGEKWYCWKILQHCGEILDEIFTEWVAKISSRLKSIRRHQSCILLLTDILEGINCPGWTAGMVVVLQWCDAATWRGWICLNYVQLEQVNANYMLIIQKCWKRHDSIFSMTGRCGFMQANYRPPNITWLWTEWSSPVICYCILIILQWFFCFFLDKIYVPHRNTCWEYAILCISLLSNYSTGIFHSIN